MVIEEWRFIDALYMTAMTVRHDTPPGAAPVKRRYHPESRSGYPPAGGDMLVLLGQPEDLRPLEGETSSRKR
jgi:hypothetical protein